MIPDNKFLRICLLAGALLIAIAVGIYLAPLPPAAFTLLSDVYPMGLSIAGAILAYLIHRRQKTDRAGYIIWGSMTLGLACWGLGETIWTLYDVLLHQPVPDPSPADIFWIIGYIPLFFSLGYQYLSLRASVPRSGRLLIAAIFAGVFLLTVSLVVIPILSSPQSGTAFGAFFDLAYPVGDLLLLLLGMALFTVFLGGQLAFSWGVITAGILLLSISDLLFSYGTWHGSFSPNGQMNFLTGLFDILYISAYVVWDAGLFLRLRLPEPGKDVNLQSYIPEAGKDYLLIADSRGQIVFLDPALVPVLGLKNAEEGMGSSFGQLFGLPRLFTDAAIRKAAKTGVSDGYKVTLGLSRKKYRLRAVASSDPNQFPGFDILLHPDTQRFVPENDREALLLDQIAYSAREREKMQRFSGEGDPLRVYFNTVIDMLFILLCRAGGLGVGEAFEKILNQKARKAGSGFEIQKGHAVWSETGTEPGIYRVLLEEAINYSQSVIAKATIDRKIQEIEKCMDPGIVRQAEQARMRGTREAGGEI